jgi:hypothetical protein
MLVGPGVAMMARAAEPTTSPAPAPADPTASASPEATTAAGSTTTGTITGSQDPDHDGLPSDWERKWSRTDPHRADTDGDGRKDGHEDPDKDGLDNRREYRLGLDPHRADTDHDGKPDGDEDTDHDGLTNLQEISLGLDPTNPDSDGDHIKDGADDLDGDRLSNHFELRWSKTDPLHADSDHDGIHDGAEDPDHDLLSNAGEERAGTNPRKADTDGDGRDDWHEDADHDGQSNGMEQDRRPVPANLTPTLAKAPTMDPVGVRDGCHVSHRIEVPHVCSYYGTDSSRSLFLVGDSHALQWQPALMEIAQRNGWRLYMSTKSGCPVPTITVLRQDDSVATDCDLWRQAVFADIEALHPDLVIVASRNDYHIDGAYDPGSRENQRLWHDGMVTSLTHLKAASDQVVWLGDTPQWSRDIPSCLLAHPRNLAACEDRVSHAISTVRTANDRAIAAEVGVSFKTTARLVCPYDPCPVVIDRFLLTRDDDHLSPPFSAALSRGVERLLPPAVQAAKRTTKRHP